MHNKPILVIQGPTASGKSALGIHLAQKLDAVIINADTMQCYADLRIITARPSDAEMEQAPHKLYGIWSTMTHGNAAMWHDLVIAEIDAAHEAEKLPILLGGTGMYIKTLIDGMAPIPSIPPLLHEATKARWHDDPKAFYEALCARDPIMGAKLEANDQQRCIRAWEVLEHTNTSLADWQKKPTTPTFKPEQFIQCVVDVPRDVLYERINLRFDQMVHMGMLEEIEAMVRSLRKNQPDITIPTLNDLEKTENTKKYNSLPLLRALGVPEVLTYLAGDMALEDAIEQAKMHTRRYAKRQLTWIRNQCDSALPIPYDLLKNSEKADLFVSNLAKRLDRALLNH